MGVGVVIRLTAKEGSDGPKILYRDFSWIPPGLCFTWCPHFWHLLVHFSWKFNPQFSATVEEADEGGLEGEDSSHVTSNYGGGVVQPGSPNGLFRYEPTVCCTDTFGALSLSRLSVSFLWAFGACSPCAIMPIIPGTTILPPVQCAMWGIIYSVYKIYYCHFRGECKSTTCGQPVILMQTPQDFKDSIHSNLSGTLPILKADLVILQKKTGKLREMRSLPQWSVVTGSFWEQHETWSGLHAVESGCLVLHLSPILYQLRDLGTVS